MGYKQSWKIAKLVLGVITASSLSGCVGLDAVYLAGTVISQNINIVARSESDIKIQDGVKVYSISMKQQTSFFTTPCHYKGVMVEYARDWAETDQSTGIVLPPAPDKPIGYALILTKETCPGKSDRDIFSTDAKFFYPLFGRNYVLREGHRMDAVDYASQREDFRPKWLPQVLKTIHMEASHNKAAQDFETDMSSRSNSNEAKSMGA